MQLNSNLINRKKILFAFILVLILALSSSGGFLFYKKETKAQSSNPAPAPEAAAADNRSNYSIIKSAYGPGPNGQEIERGEDVTIDLSIQGALDELKTPQKADVMIVIDRSITMADEAPGDKCTMTGPDPDPNKSGTITYKNTKLCYARKAAQLFVDRSGQKAVNMHLGYVTFGHIDKTQGFGGNQFFSPMLDMNDRANRINLGNDIEKITYHPRPYGTAMGEAVKIANEELARGRSEANKYIILLTDGIGNMEPYLTGCAKKYETNFCAVDNWPLTWPDDPGDPNAGGCFTSTEENCEVGVKPFGGSPAGKAWDKHIKIITLGFGLANRMQEDLLRRIAQYTFDLPVSCLGDRASEDDPACNLQYYPNSSEAELKNAFRQIFSFIIGEAGAPITITESLPSGASIVNVSKSKNSGYRGPLIYSTPNGSDGRPQIIITVTADNYPRGVTYSSHTFYFSIVFNTADMPIFSDFDADQNWECRHGTPGKRIADKPEKSLSKAVWSFKDESSHLEPMPAGCLYARGSQYSGDIYGQGISAYAFPGIDVAVSSGVNNADKSIWNLSQYNFSATSYSNYEKFLAEIAKIQSSLIKRASNGPQDINSLIGKNNAHQDIYPEGEVYVLKDTGQPAIVNGATIGDGSRTIIVEGKLIIKGIINKKSSNSKDNLLLLVNGDVEISAGVGSVQAAIVTPNNSITIADGSIGIKIFGLLVGREVNLRNLGARAQQINYDPNLALYPPPGLSQIGLPIFKEVKP